MGMFNDESNQLGVYSVGDNTSANNSNEGGQDKAMDQAMDNLSHQRRPSSSKHSCSDYKDDCDEADNDSTASTIDSNLLHSSGLPSPALSPLQGQQFLVQRGDFGVDRTSTAVFLSEDSFVNGVNAANMIDGPNLSTITSVLHDGVYIGSGVGELTMLSSAACSVSTAPSTVDEASSIDMDSATTFDHFRLRNTDSTAKGTTSGNATLPPLLPQQNVQYRHHRIPSWEASPHQQVLNISHNSNMITSINANSYIPLDQGSFTGLPPQQLPLNQQQDHHDSGWPAIHQSSRQLPSQQSFSHQQLQQHPHQRVATFRSSDHSLHHQQQQQISSRHHPPSPSSGRHHFYQQQMQWQHHHHIPTSPTPPHRYGNTDSHIPMIPMVGPRQTDSRSNAYHRSNSSNAPNVGNPYQVQTPTQQQRKAGMYNQPLLPPTLHTPVRNSNNRDATVGPSRGVAHLRTNSSGGHSASSTGKISTNASVTSPHRSPQGGQHTGLAGTGTTQGIQVSSNNPRSSSEILKTLLRKKACLYEPDTSRAVALVTWLVGRELALEYGYFSRQQLQAGVHACVTNKIDSGVITRTKVNRCMQIILNSCFHYIIPRPDGTEENGDAFRAIFANEIQTGTETIDSTELLNTMPLPWRDMHVNREDILIASSCADDASTSHPKKEKGGGLETPSHSPRMDGILPETMSPKELNDIAGDGTGDGKRAVLLCFNENVRRAEDVFRCHNEFIRDTAHASNLQLSSNEWLLFFGADAAKAPHLWGNVGIPIPYTESQGPGKIDALGVFSQNELAAFRTTWCSKRYDHNHELCGFAHAEVNNGWLRRNPITHTYKDEMCSFVTTVEINKGMVDMLSVGDELNDNLPVVVINECPHGVNCPHAHSVEEIIYHPNRYKQSKTCSFSSRVGGCPLGDVCPNFHPADSYRYPKKSDSRSPRHSRQQHHQHHHSNPGLGKGSATQSSSTNPPGTPILYVSPAPISSFEHHLQIPGLQSLYRRHCAVMRAHLCRNGINCCYTCFGDDAGIETSGNTISQLDTAIQPLTGSSSVQQPIEL